MLSRGQSLAASSDYNDRTGARSSELGGGLFILDTESRICRENNWLFQAVCKDFVDLWAAEIGKGNIGI